jgi:mxaJ protein
MRVSSCPRRLALLAAALCAVAAQAGTARELRVCADPNNLPFSNEAREGFENALAEIVAEELDAGLTYTWWAQRRGFIRNTLGSGACELVMGVPAGYELVETTRPYYRSTYVFVHSPRVGEPLTSMRDPRLRDLTIGVHLTGDDGSNPPPAHSLGQQGIVDNVVGFMIYGDYRQPNPPARLIDAVASGDIDVAAAWGPTAGYFARRADAPLALQPITDTAFAALPFEFSIAMGVRKGQTAFRDEVQAAIDRRQADIRAVLTRYDVPLVPLGSGADREEAEP